jgi:hypothetical protein
MKESKVTEKHRETLGREPWAQESAALKPAKGFIYESTDGGRVVLERYEPDERQYGENAWHHGGAVSSVPTSVSANGWKLVGIQTPNGPVMVGECRAYDGKPNADHGLGQIENVVAQNGVAVRRLDGVLTVWEADVVASWPMLSKPRGKGHRPLNAEVSAAPERATPLAGDRRVGTASTAAPAGHQHAGPVGFAIADSIADRGVLLDRGDVVIHAPSDQRFTVLTGGVYHDGERIPLAAPGWTAPAILDDAELEFVPPRPGCSRRARLVLARAADRTPAPPTALAEKPAHAAVKPGAVGSDWKERQAEILEILREDARVHPEFARAREVAVVTACEGRGALPNSIKDLLRTCRSYERKRGGARTPARGAREAALTLLGQRVWAPAAIDAYERARS